MVCGGRGREGHVYASCVTRLEKVQVRRILRRNGNGLSETAQRDSSSAIRLFGQFALAFNMVPQRRLHRPPPRLYCPVQGCHKGLQSKSGLTQHIQAIHRDLHLANLQPWTEPYAPSVELDDLSSPHRPDNLRIPHMSDFPDAGDWETFGFTPGRAESVRSDRQTSPSLYDDESLQEGLTEYHPLINGKP